LGWHRVRFVSGPAHPGYSSHFDVDEVFVAQIEEGGDPADGSSRFSRALNAAAREAIDDAEIRAGCPAPGSAWSTPSCSATWTCGRTCT